MAGREYGVGAILGLEPNFESLPSIVGFGVILDGIGVIAQGIGVIAERIGVIVTSGVAAMIGVARPSLGVIGVAAPTEGVITDPKDSTTDRVNTPDLVIGSEQGTFRLELEISIT